MKTRIDTYMTLDIGKFDLSQLNAHVKWAEDFHNFLTFFETKDNKCKRFYLSNSQELIRRALANLESTDE